uniref:Peptidase metallopeptidase domain-containing protein n=1 Tax=Oncorhynchus mykiss TaxID=8022 RepID=A0A8C7RMX7_ONCMY
MGLSTGSAVLFLACLGLCQAAPTSTPEVQTLPEDNETVAGVIYIIKPDIHKSLEAMQALFGLEVTGVLDKNTLEVMKESMCGVSDISRYGHFHRKQKWEKSTVTYRITQYTPDPRQSDVDATIAQAFQIYSDVIPQDFKQIHTDTADIMILFKDHGDFYPFDDSRVMLSSEVNLQLVAAHEFGHALGLDHSRDRRALMFPTYQYVNNNGYTLPDDDRRGVQALYGTCTPHLKPTPKPEPKPGPEPEPKEPTENPKPDSRPNSKDEQCNRDLVFEAVSSIRGELYFFKNGYFWLKSTAVQGIRLTKVSSRWAQINYVDAAYEVPAKYVVHLFEGTVMTGMSKRILPGYQKSISNLGILSSVTKLDASVYVPTRGKTLFLVIFEARRQMYYGYPRSITQDFPGIGSKVDAVFENLFCYLYFSDGPRQSEYYLAYKRVIGVLLNYGWLDCYYDTTTIDNTI